MKLFYVPSHFGTPSINRQKTFDVAKGVAVLLMVMIHVLDFYGLPEVRFSAFGATVKFARRLGIIRESQGISRGSWIIIRGT